MPKINNLLKAGRKFKQKKLRSLLNDSKISSFDRGWIRQEINSIKRGNRKTIRVPIGKELAHYRGYEASKGYNYTYSQLNTIANHRLQHKYDKGGKLNKEKAVQIKRSINK